MAVRLSPSQARIARYLGAGAIACTANLLTLAFCVEVIAIYPTVASCISYVVGAIVNYLFNYYWTFNADGKHHIALARYGAILALMTAFNTLIFWLLYHQLGLWVLLSQFLALAVIVPISYTLNRRYTFA